MDIFDVYKTGDGTLHLQKVREPQDKFEGTRITTHVWLSNASEERVFRLAIKAVNQLIKDARCYSKKA